MNKLKNFISLKTTNELFSSFRKIQDVAERREITKLVHAEKLKVWKKDKRYKLTVARHLVEDVHGSMFRDGFEKILTKSLKQEKLQLMEFKRLNTILHRHHEHEDIGWFPALRQSHPEVVEEIDILEKDHKVLVTLEKKIDKGEIDALTEFVNLLNDHLNREEMLSLPYLMDGTGGIH